MLTILLAAAAGAAAEPPVVVTSREPRRPDAAASSFSVDCGGTRLELVQHRPSADALRLPELRVGGEAMPVPARLRDDLSQPNAVYRFGGRCLTEAGGFQVDVWEMTRRRGEPARYLGAG
jgi:hypothetical protein